MAVPISDLASVIFHDVAVYFSSEEWEILTDWQKELYKNVMREIHGALVALGYTIVNRSTLLRVKEKTEAWGRGDRNEPPATEESVTNPTSTTSYPSVKPDIYLRIEREKTACPWTLRDSRCPVFDPKLSLWIKQENVATFSDEEQELEEEEENGSLPSTRIDSSVVDPDQPQWVKREKTPALYPDGQQNVESLSGPGAARAQPSAQLEVSQEVKQKERPHLKARHNSEGKKFPSEPPTTTDVSRKGTPMLPAKPTRLAATKRMELKLRDKILVLQEYEKRKVSMRELAAQFGVSKTQIGQIVKRKEELLTEYLNDASGDRVRRRRRTENEQLNTMVWDWIRMVRAENVALSGAVVKRKALELAEQLGVTEFKASNGWLDSFKRAHNLHQFTSASCWSQGELR